jgi:CBS domain containing-hemolysin-like protein
MSPLGDDSWEVTGITTLRRIGRHFHVPLEQSASVTVAGILQEILQRIPEPGDECTWSGFHFHVLEASPDDPMRVVLRRLSAEGERA